MDTIVFKASQVSLQLDFTVKLGKSEINSIKTHFKALTYVAEAFLEQQLKLSLNHISTLSLSVCVCGHRRIRSLNRNYRYADKTTDVLSFPLHDSLRDGKVLPGLLELGDIFICYPMAKVQAKEFSLSTTEELCHLFVHGFLHLVGYDHEISEDEKNLMEKKEKKMIEHLSKKMRG